MAIIAGDDIGGAAIVLEAGIKDFAFTASGPRIYSVNGHVYFAFSDETGDYEANRSERFGKAHPFFVRSCVLIRAAEWRFVRQTCRQVLEKHEYPSGYELKWSFLWSLSSHERTGKRITRDKDYYFLRDWSSRQLLELYWDVLGVLQALDYVKVILSVTDNRTKSKIKASELMRFHLQEHMQRLEMEIQNEPDSLCVLFIDPCSRKRDEQLRDAYQTIAESGDLIAEYSHIKDSLNTEKSHHSIGVQLADIVGGAFAGCLRGYEKSRSLFLARIVPFLRRAPSGQTTGYGIREVPRSTAFREEIVRLVNKPGQDA